jgi:hypothetical protein
VEEPNRLFALELAFSLDDIMGVIEDDPITALAGSDPAKEATATAPAKVPKYVVATG